MQYSNDIHEKQLNQLSEDPLKLENIVIQKVSHASAQPTTVTVGDISLKAVPYTCDIIRNHCRWCDCKSPRLHAYLATKHRCDSYCITSGENTTDGYTGDTNMPKLDSDATDLVNHNSSDCGEDLVISEAEDAFEDIEDVLLGDDTFLGKPSLLSVKKTFEQKSPRSKKLLKQIKSSIKKKSTKKNNKTRQQIVVSNMSLEYQKIIERQPIVSLVALSPSSYRKHYPKSSGVSEKWTLKQEPVCPHSEDISVTDFSQELEQSIDKPRREQPIKTIKTLESSPNYSFSSLLSEESIKREPPDNDDLPSSSPHRLLIDEEANLSAVSDHKETFQSHPEQSQGDDEEKEATVSFINPIKIKINFKSIKDTKKEEKKQEKCENTEENPDIPSILNSFSLADNPEEKQNQRFTLNNPESLSCAACKMDFEKFQDLVVHLINHQKEGIILCYYCQKAFGDKTGMKRHMRVHTGEKPYECRVCFKRFSLPGNFKKHRDIHANVRSEPCPVCKKTFRRKEHLKNHMMIHTGEKPYKCNKCDSSFAARYSLQIHMNIHLNHRPYICSYCDKKFADKSTMRKHIRIHTGEKPFECEVCFKRFGESGTLAHHMWTHRSERPYKCDRCDLRFKNTAGLKQHSRIHEDTKRFACTFCGVKFRLKYNMKMHERIHTGEKPYSCNQCPLKFRSLSCVTKHALCHSDVTDRKFPCTYCKKRFYRKSHLRRHLDMHLGIKSFNCDKCGKGFSSSKTLNHHAKIFHSVGARNFPCYVCGKVFKREVYVTNHNCKGLKEELKGEPNETINDETTQEISLDENLIVTQETIGSVKEEPQ